jgi:transformation/transcription domain-associated protein
MLADLIHHVRAELTLPQLSRIIHMYSANVHDPTLASAIQTMCSKLLLNLVDPISNKEPVEAAKVMQRILVTFVSKMEGMAEMRDEWSKWSKAREPLAVVLGHIAEREKAREAAAAKEGEKEGEDVAMEEVEPKDDEAKDEATKDKPDAAMQVDAVVKPEVEELPLIELDDVDIERAKPIGKTVVMVDVGQDPVKGE